MVREWHWEFGEITEVDGVPCIKSANPNQESLYEWLKPILDEQEKRIERLESLSLEISLLKRIGKA